MEPRKIIFVDTKTQSQYVLEKSVATTLGELKAEMREAAIPYAGMTFYCGQMRAELKDDAAPIPEQVMFRGEPVRDLAFMLTTPEKKITSGAMTRKELYEEVKKNKLEEECKKFYGRNFTQVSTDDLVYLISKYAGQKEIIDIEPSVKVKKITKEETPKETPDSSLDILLQILRQKNVISQNDYNKIMGKEATELLSQSEIDDLFDFVG